MSFLLHFARALQIRSMQTNAQFEMMCISNQQSMITNRIAELEKTAKSLDKDNPEIKTIQCNKQMLVSMSNALDMRLKLLQTRVQTLSAEEQTLEKVLPDEVARSAPKYCA